MALRNNKLSEAERKKLEEIRERAIARGLPQETREAVSFVQYVKPDGINFKPGRDYQWLYSQSPPGTPLDLRKLLRNMIESPNFRKQMEKAYLNLLAFTSSDLAQYAPRFTEYLEKFGKVSSELEMVQEPFIDSKNLEAAIQGMGRNSDEGIGPWVENAEWQIWSMVTGILLSDMESAKAWGYDKIRKEEHIVYVSGAYAGRYSAFLDPRKPGIRGNYRTIEIEGKPYSVGGHVFAPTEQFSGKTKIGKLGARLEFATSNDWGCSLSPHLLMKRQDDLRNIPFP